MAEALITATTRHQVFLERLKTHEAREYAQFLGDIDRSLRLRLMGEDITEFSRYRMELLLRQVESDMRLIMGDAYDEFYAKMVETAIYESEFEARNLTNAVAFESVIPSPEQVKAAVFSTPLSIRAIGGGMLLDSFIKDWNETQIKRVTGAIRQGYFEGQTTSQIIRALRGTKAANYSDGVLGQANRSLNTVVRTSLQHVASTARMATWDANESVIKGYQWIATLDGRTSQICRSLDGQVFKIGKGPLPPLHPNCLTGDTDILTRSCVSDVYKRAYKGTVVDLATESGRTITITPNHPILTGRGWVAAGDLELGDEIACISDADFRVDNHEDCVKAKFSDLFAAANISVDPLATTDRPAATENFHGDGAGGDVSVINVDSLAWSRIRKVLENDTKKCGFVLRKAIRATFLRLRSLAQFIVAYFSAPCGVVSRFCQACDFLRRASCHASELLFRSVPLLQTTSSDGLFYNGRTNSDLFSDASDTNAIEEHGFYIPVIDSEGCSVRFTKDSDGSSFEVTQQSVISDAELGANLLGGSAGRVKLDRLVNKVVRSFSGQVYNLSNEENWYLANGIIAHNCRSSTIAVLKDKYKFLSEGRTRASKDGYVPADLTYYEWLKLQPEGFQDAALGKSRAKLFREGGLTAERFAELNVGRNFEPLTLEEMRDIEPLAFEKAGI